MSRIVRIFLLQEALHSTKQKLKKLKYHPMIKEKEKSVFFLHLFLGEKKVAFVLTQKYPHTSFLSFPLPPMADLKPCYPKQYLPTHLTRKEKLSIGSASSQ